MAGITRAYTFRHADFPRSFRGISHLSKNACCDKIRAAFSICLCSSLPSPLPPHMSRGFLGLPLVDALGIERRCAIKHGLRNSATSCQSYSGVGRRQQTPIHQRASLPLGDAGLSTTNWPFASLHYSTSSKCSRICNLLSSETCFVRTNRLWRLCHRIFVALSRL